MVSLWREPDQFPVQDPITEQTLRDLQNDRRRRRWRLNTDWREVLRPPDDRSPQWKLTLPCKETFWNLVLSLELDTSGPQSWADGTVCGVWIEQSDPNGRGLWSLRDLFEKVGRYVAMRDGLAMSFALDFTKKDGNPTLAATEVGSLRAAAKTYGGPVSGSNIEAANQLSERLLSFIADVRCYGRADSVCAVPGSDPNAKYQLSSYLAQSVASALDLPDLSSQLATRARRPGLKNAAIDTKFELIEGSIRADPGAFHARTVILIDDLYQSGISVNYAAMTLMTAGVHAIFGLTCEKTCRNTDNVS